MALLGNIYGNEGIGFQVRSDLGKAIQAAIQNTINFRDTLNYSGARDPVNYRKTQVTNYVKTTLFPELVKVIKKYANFDIISITAYNSCSGFFAINLSLDDWYSTAKMMERASGTGTGAQRINASKTDAFNEICDLHKNLDISTGKLRSNKFGINKQRSITARLFFDLNYAFLIKDFYPNSIVEDSTAEELTAILLHEIGHMICLVERSGDLYLTTERISKHIAEANNLPGDVRSFVASSKNNANKLLDIGIKEGFVTNETKQLIMKATATLEKYYETTRDGNFFRNISDWIESLISTIMMAIIVATFGAYAAIGTGYLLKLCEEVFGNVGGDGKVSDAAVSFHGSYMYERMADEFVARHGYGGALASALVKIGTLADISPFVASGTSLRQSKLFGYYLNFVVTCFRIIGADNTSIGGVMTTTYEQQQNRLKRIIQSTMGAFKQELPPEVRNQYIAQVERAKSELSKTQMVSKKIGKNIRTIAYHLATFNGVLERWFGDPREAKKQFDQLQTEIESIIDNEIYFISAKFNQLKDR